MYTLPVGLGEKNARFSMMQGGGYGGFFKERSGGHNIMVVHFDCFTQHHMQGEN